MKFFFTGRKGEKVFENEDLIEVEVVAKKYKEENSLLSLQIKVDRGQFFKWA